MLFILLLLPVQVNSQELKANITLNTSKIQGTNTEVFDVLRESLNEFINNRKWTEYEYEEYERVTCNFTSVFSPK